MLAAGRNSIFCYTTNGFSSCYGVGLNSYNELGRGNTAPTSTYLPLPAPMAGNTFSLLASMKSRFGSDSASWSAIGVFGVTSTGRLITWGDAREGKAARYKAQDYRDISIPTNSILSMATSRYAMAFTARDGLLYTLGANEPPGILGVGSGSQGSSGALNVVPVNYPIDGTITTVTGGEGFFAVVVKGVTKASIGWWGQLPTNPIRTAGALESAGVDLLGKNIVLACGRAHCAAANASYLTAWGFNHNSVRLLFPSFSDLLTIRRGCLASYH